MPAALSAALAAPGGALAARRPAAAAAPGAQPRRPARLAVAAAAGRSEADLYQGVTAPQGPPQGAGNPLAGQPPYVTVPLALVGALAALRVAKALKKRM